MASSSNSEFKRSYDISLSIRGGLDTRTQFTEFKCSYDIFLSFRGLDTRTKFTDHLYEALKREGFETFRDNEGIERGENIYSELQKAIWNSSMSVIVLSKTYATSKSCLFEIQTILEHRKKNADHVILPVFYEVEPLEIREQAKKLDFGEKKVTVEEVEGWSAALKEVSSMGGMVYGNQSNRSEVKFIEEIIGVLKVKQADKHLRDLDENMQNLKRKVEYLSGQENDINSQISNAERRPGKRPKKEVEVWLKNVQQFKDSAQRLEQEVVEETTNVSLRMQLGKDIAKKILEVQELQKKGSDFNSLMIDEDTTGRLLQPLTEDFVKCTKARNTENIWECVTNDDVTRIGVYGMGGIGKTTIMKHIHNQLLEEKDKFDNVYWVTVSKAFDITKLQSDIAKALDLPLREDEEVTKRATKLHAVLDRLKRYILILDDVWEPFDLDSVGIPEPKRSNGCKLVLTTRSSEVCRRMKCTPVRMGLFTEDETLTLFLTKAIGHDTVLAPEVEEIAAKIAKECARLPLAVVTVTGSLRGLEGIHEWRNALNELIRSTKEANNGKTKVFEILKFSYDRLGSKVLQDCFLYCSLYPQDRFIPVNELIEYWIAEELIADMDSVEEQFDKGHAILGKLKSSCLLESVADIQKMMEYVKLHDSIRDMALRITASSPRFLVNAGETKKRVPCEHWSKDLERISFMYSLIIKLPIAPPVCPRLTTLLLNGAYSNGLEGIPDSFFTNMPCLEVLDLSRSKITSLPESISNLENLHALKLNDCSHLKYVPSLKKLKALKMFILTCSQIEELPEGIEKLVNLRKLNLSSNFSIRKTVHRWMLHRLSKLQYLRIDGTGIELSAEDLLCFSQLKVVAVKFHNVQELIRYAMSQQFQGLQKYGLIVGKYCWCKSNLGKEVWICDISKHFGSMTDLPMLPAGIESFVLDGFHDLVSLSNIPWLKDAKDLRKCKVKCCNRLESIFSSSSFSEDGQISLGTVESFCLSNLPRLRVLLDGIAPPHNIYFNLKELDFSRCHALKNIFPVQLLQNFPNLERLSVMLCKNVEDMIVEIAEMSDWGNHQDYSNSISLPKLKILELSDIPRLKSIYNGVMVCPSIEEVQIRDCNLVSRLPISLHMDGEQATAPPALKFIAGKEEWWESLEWDDPLAKTILQPYFMSGIYHHYVVSDLKYG
ncbi:disease resistance protein At4g27190-like [Rhododendron vialii]|uniref:disease resistance protein At4g27190-like n=1 Tax=Rhododendron vialii TaxID=182163 RepID=UPI00265D8032|nr:disease resistance protein At4g27190-like [Rhododendron vialii]